MEDWEDLAEKRNEKCRLCFKNLRVFKNRDWKKRKYHKKCYLNKKNKKCIICSKKLHKMTIENGFINCYKCSHHYKNKIILNKLMIDLD